MIGRENGFLQAVSMEHFLKGLLRIVRRPGFWLILVLMFLITIPHYQEFIKHPWFITSLISYLQLERHAFERILYMVPIIWSGLIFGWKGSLVTSLISLGLMLPRIIFYSSFIRDAIFETSLIFIVGNLCAFSFASLRRLREKNEQINLAHEELKKIYQKQKLTNEELQLSERKYRNIFENANYAIWLHDMDGNIIDANQATETLTGYRVDELLKMNVKAIISFEELQPATEPYEQCIIKKNGSKIFVQLTTSLILGNSGPVAFQHIGRDISDERRLKQNQRNYLQQVTRAQEEERKRISRELHDETIQSLVVLSRNLDSLENSREVTEATRLRLEELRRQTTEVMAGIRRLSQDLRPAALDRLGLWAALEWLISEISKFSSINTHLTKIGDEKPLPEEITLVLFRITQEAIRNAWRHSKATQVDISVKYGESGITITVRDNGIGFDMSKTPAGVTGGSGLGIIGMQERANLINGSLAIQSEPEKGCKVEITVPYFE